MTVVYTLPHNYYAGICKYAAKIDQAMGDRVYNYYMYVHVNFMNGPGYTKAIMP